jgi:hypothetical protein
MHKHGYLNSEYAPGGIDVKLSEIEIAGTQDLVL